MLSIKDGVDLLERLLKWRRSKLNPVRQQAARVLETFEAYGIGRTQVNSFLPAELRLPAMRWSDPDELKGSLCQEHIDWLEQRFSLESGWLAGVNDKANRDIFSYKSPELLHEWLATNRRGESGFEFKLHFVTPDAREINHLSNGYYALVLEQMEEDIDAPPRFFHLTEGGHFEHYPSLVHLLQVLAIAYHHGAIMRRSQLNVSDLYKLSHHKGLIPHWLDKSLTHPLAADHELWPHYSGRNPWLDELRQHTEDGLLTAGLACVVELVHADEARFARPSSSVLNAI